MLWLVHAFHTVVYTDVKTEGNGALERYFSKYIEVEMVEKLDEESFKTSVIINSATTQYISQKISINEYIKN